MKKEQRYELIDNVRNVYDDPITANALSITLAHCDNDFEYTIWDMLASQIYSLEEELDK